MTTTDRPASTTTRHNENPSATPRAHETESEMPHIQHQQQAGQHVAADDEVIDLQLPTVPRQRFLELRRLRDRERKAADKVFLRLADAVAQNFELRAQMDKLRATAPDAVALYDARRENNELAHTLASTLRVLSGISKQGARTAAYANELLINKGRDPAVVDLQEVAS